MAHSALNLLISYELQKHSSSKIKKHPKNGIKVQFCVTPINIKISISDVRL